MKGKKCIKYLILCITFLLSLNLSLNASAKVKSVDSRYFDTFQWYYNGSTQQTANVTNGGLINSITLNAAAERVSTLGLMKFNLRTNARLNNNTLVRFKIIFKSNLEYANNSVFPSCPRGANHFLIDKCVVSNADQEQIIEFVNEWANTSQPPEGNDWIYTGEYSIYHIMEIEGHFDYQDFTTISTIETYNTFYTFVNSESLTSHSVNLIMFIAPIEFVIEEQTAEDEAAEKELEDRDNLETQQTESEDSAEDSSDSFETSTTNITGVISGFVTSLNSLQIGNCTLPEISAYGFSLGNINLCTFTPPTWIQGVTTVIISLITLGLAWHVFRRIMGIAKSLAGSK